jgi:dual specificity phosphatase 12
MMFFRRFMVLMRIYQRYAYPLPHPLRTSRTPKLFETNADINSPDILSVIDFDLYENSHFHKYTHLQIKLDDDPNENLLIHFPQTNAFIEAALQNGQGRVFVHCAMGKSRSATVVCAYLMFKFGVSPSKALEQLCEGRPVCEPNPGFQEQLKVYERMLKAGDEAEGKGVYQDWVENRYTGTWYNGESECFFEGLFVALLLALWSVVFMVTFSSSLWDLRELLAGPLAQSFVDVSGQFRGILRRRV